MICGIDEAGRGALIGPMVIAGVVIDKKYEKKLKSLGVKDSKQLSPKKRESLAKEIEKIAKNVVILRVPACKIDSYRANKINLDRIEAMKMGDIINICNAKEFYIDSLGTNTKRFKDLILNYISNKKVKLIVENFADQKYPVVSAASIMAKTSRDEAVREIEKKLGEPIGVGYSHDERTVKLVEKLIKERRKLPPYIRKSWITVQNLKENSWQKRLKDFIKKKVKI